MQTINVPYTNFAVVLVSTLLNIDDCNRGEMRLPDLLKSLTTANSQFCLIPLTEIPQAVSSINGMKLPDMVQYIYVSATLRVVLDDPVLVVEEYIPNTYCGTDCWLLQTVGSPSAA